MKHLELMSELTMKEKESINGGFVPPETYPPRFPGVPGPSEREIFIREITGILICY